MNNKSKKFLPPGEACWQIWVDHRGAHRTLFLLLKKRRTGNQAKSSGIASLNLRYFICSAHIYDQPGPDTIANSSIMQLEEMKRIKFSPGETGGIISSNWQDEVLIPLIACSKVLTHKQKWQACCMFLGTLLTLDSTLCRGHRRIKTPLYNSLIQTILHIRSSCELIFPTFMCVCLSRSKKWPGELCMFTQEMQSAVGKGKSKKTRLFLFAAAEILSPRCRVLSSITNLSLGLDGHRGAVLALLALSVSLFFYILHHANKPEWESSREGELKRKDGGGKKDNTEAGRRNGEGGKVRKEGNGWLKTRVILCVFMVDRKKEGVEEWLAGHGGERNARPWHRRKRWRMEYAHIAAANRAHSHSRVMETF